MSVAIRTVTDLKYLDDVNVTVGAGVHEYALCWDNDTLKFVLRAMGGGVTDHGALTGLADDDHTGYALLAGRAGGTTLYGGTAANEDIAIHGTAHATRTTSYVLLQPSGGNVGIGTTSPATLFHGLLTSAATNAVTNVLTLGHDTTGAVATGFGAGVLFQLESSTTAAQDAARIASLWTNATHATRASALTFSTLTAGGSLTEHMRIDGAGNVGIGTSAPGGKLNVVSAAYPVVEFTRAINGNDLRSAMTIKREGTTAFGENASIAFDFSLSDPVGGTHPAAWIGFVRGNSQNYLGALVFGNYTSGSGIGNTERMRISPSGHVGIGTTAPATLLHGLLTSAATNAVTNVLTLGHDTTGAVATGFGAGVLFQLESSTTAAQDAARIQALWYEATHATRKADLVLTAYDSGGEREGLRIRGAGSAAAIGFLGAPPAARVAHVADPAGGGTVDAEARSAINSILATLETFGFHATS